MNLRWVSWSHISGADTRNYHVGLPSCQTWRDRFRSSHRTFPWGLCVCFQGLLILALHVCAKAFQIGEQFLHLRFLFTFIRLCTYFRQIIIGYDHLSTQGLLPNDCLSVLSILLVHQQLYCNLILLNTAIPGQNGWEWWDHELTTQLEQLFTGRSKTVSMIFNDTANCLSESYDLVFDLT